MIRPYMKHTETVICSPSAISITTSSDPEWEHTGPDDFASDEDFGSKQTNQT